jgi:DNA-binding NtrC family response regulator
MLTSHDTDLFAGRTLLIAEPDPDVAALLGDVFEQLGASVVTARNALSAASAARTRAFDLAIFSAVLPDANAWNVLDDIASVRPELARRTLLTTADVYNDALLRDIHKAGLPVLLKPFELNELRTLAAEVLQDARREYSLTAA